MYNIIINGINIGLTYRNQFASAMNAPENNGSLDAVIDGWGETIAHVDPATQGGQGEAQRGDPSARRRRVMFEVTSTDALHHSVRGSPTLANAKGPRVRCSMASLRISRPRMPPRNEQRPPTRRRRTVVELSLGGVTEGNSVLVSLMLVWMRRARAAGVGHHVRRHSAARREADRIHRSRRGVADGSTAERTRDRRRR